MNPFIDLLNRFTPLSAESQRALADASQRLTLAKGHVLVQADTISEFIYFIESGLARTYYYKDGRDVTDWLSAEHQFAGSMVSFLSRERKLVAMGQTGVEHLPLPLIRFIGLSELVGVAGLLLPGLTHQLPVLTPLAALCLGLIMIPAAFIHYRRGKMKSVFLNGVILVVCLRVAYGRWRASSV